MHLTCVAFLGSSTDYITSFRSLKLDDAQLILFFFFFFSLDRITRTENVQKRQITTTTAALEGHLAVFGQIRNMKKHRLKPKATTRLKRVKFNLFDKQQHSQILLFFYRLFIFGILLLHFPLINFS